MIKSTVLIIFAFLFFLSPHTYASRSAINVDVRVETGEQPSVHLSWNRQRASASELQVTVYRRELGVKSGIWYRNIMQDGRLRSFAEMTLFEPIAELPPSATGFTDTQVERGKHYEYRVHRPELENRYNEAATYFVVSLDVPVADQHGTILLVVDETLVEDLVDDLRLLELDLAGDGWSVTRLLTPRHPRQDPQDLHRAIREAVRDDPEIQGLYLFGHVPVVRSGFLAPDGHQNSPHETDLYYADLTGAWTDLQFFSDSGGESRSNIPRDGKFDHSNLLKAIDIMVGRVDLSRLSAARKSELELLRDYVHKTHAWRNGDRQVPYRALLNSSHLFQEHTWARAMFGKDGVTDAAFQPELNTEAYLWAMDFGHWDGGFEEHYVGVQNRALFFLNFGSGKQKWMGGKNAMRMLLAQPDWGLAVGWGARPAWHMHQMAAGWTVGQSHLRTVNNAFNGREFYPGGRYAHLESQVHINLMGDPTLRLHVAAPPKVPAVVRGSEGVVLSWEAPDEGVIEGYLVYRSDDPVSGYQRLGESMLEPDVRSYLDVSAAATGPVYYQIRAVHRNETRSGVYQLASRAAYVWLAEQAAEYRPPVAQPAVEQQVVAGESVVLQIPGASDHHVVILQHPEQGQIRWEKGEPVYVSEPGFSGSDTLVYRLFDGIGLSEPSVLTVQVSTNQ